MSISDWVRLYPAWLLSVAIWMLSPSVEAARVEGMYEAEVYVRDQSGDERIRGFRLAMDDVLTRVTGDSAVSIRDEIVPVYRRAQAFVEEYRYLPVETDKTAPQAETVEEAPGFRLYVRFAELNLNAALREKGIPVWGSDRPDVLVWLAIEDRGQRTLVSGLEKSAARQELALQAQEKALPLVLPRLDKTDRQALSFIDIRGGFIDKIRAASARYETNVVLAGHLALSGRSWLGRWWLIDSGQVKYWQSSHVDINTSIVSGIEGLSRILVDQYALGGTEATTSLYVEVDQIRTLDQYADVLQYLAALPVVSRADVHQVAPQRTTYLLTLNGRPADFERAVALNSKLQKTAEAVSADRKNLNQISGTGTSTILHYRLNVR